MHTKQTNYITYKGAVYMESVNSDKSWLEEWLMDNAEMAYEFFVEKLNRDVTKYIEQTKKELYESLYHDLETVNHYAADRHIKRFVLPAMIKAWMASIPLEQLIAESLDKMEKQFGVGSSVEERKS